MYVILSLTHSHVTLLSSLLIIYHHQATYTHVTHARTHARCYNLKYTHHQWCEAMLGNTYHHSNMITHTYIDTQPVCVLYYLCTYAVQFIPTRYTCMYTYIHVNPRHNNMITWCTYTTQQCSILCVYVLLHTLISLKGYTYLHHISVHYKNLITFILYIVTHE